MRKLFYTLIILAGMAGCSKEKEQEPVTEKSEGIAGSWLLTEQRADIGDGRGTWRHTDVQAAIFFGPEGSYHDTRSTQFNKYTFSKDTITLYNKDNLSVTYKLAVQELNASTLSYYFGWPWCGGPSGEKFIMYQEQLCNLPE